jgi:Raf kinase inhibitor-like YbhB/YbcL family protein
MEASDAISVSSPAFADGKSIPAQFTCDGDGQPPPLAWEGVPPGTAALALVVDDPDAPRGTFVHWIVLDMPGDVTDLAGSGALPSGAIQATNSAGRASYSPPCPPSGTHHYRFTVYALSEPTRLRDGAALDTALRTIESTATAQGRLISTYARSG